MTCSPLRALVWGLRGLWPHDRVSETWLREQEQHQGTRGVDHSVITQWPIDKRRNESGLWNRHRLRKRA